VQIIRLSEMKYHFILINDTGIRFIEAKTKRFLNSYKFEVKIEQQWSYIWMVGVSLGYSVTTLYLLLKLFSVTLDIHG
jgi:hypothetical protein